MAYGSLCATKYYPKDAEQMTDGSAVKAQLELGREVTLDSNGWVLDVWDPVSKKTYDDQGTEIGTRNKPFVLPEASEVRTVEAKTFTGDDVGEFDPNSRVAALLGYGLQVTLDENGMVIDVYDPATNTTRDVNNKEIGTRIFPYTEYRERQYRNPMGVTFSEADKDQYDEYSAMYKLLNAGYQVTVDERYNILDIWDPVNKQLVNLNGIAHGSRMDPYPSETNIESTKRRYKILLKEIAVLRRRITHQRGLAKIELQKELMSNLREYGKLVWLYGRLLRRSKGRNRKHERNKIGSKVPHVPSK